MAVRITAVVDTSAILDFDTTISSVKNIKSQGEKALNSDRMLMQGSAWMALALDLRRTVSVSLAYEVGTKLEKEATPGTTDGLWTHAIAHIVRPFVCPRWRVRHTYDGPSGPLSEDATKRRAQNDERDRFQYDYAKRAGIPFITWDGAALKRARRAGVDGYTPPEFGESVIAFQDARQRFMERLRIGLLCFEHDHGDKGHTLDNLHVTWETYCWMWSR